MKNLSPALIAGIVWMLTPSCPAETFTLSEANLMALDANYHVHHLNPPSVVTVVAKRLVPGQGVEFDIWYPSNNVVTNTSILWCSSIYIGDGLLTGWNMSQYDSFALDFTLLSVNGSASDGAGGTLVVGAAINHTNAAYRYDPESIGFPPYQPTTHAVSTTATAAGRIDTIGFNASLAYWLDGNPWSPTGSLVTLLVKPAAGATPIPTPMVQLSLGVSNDVATLSWSPKIPGAVLQMRDSLDAGPWTNVPSGATNPVAIPISSENRFYRVAQIPVPSDMVWISAGSFTMGNCMATNEGYSSELPLHEVYVSAFYMDKYEVTTSLWDEVYQWAITNNYGFTTALGPGKAANHPMQRVNWYDVVKWCNARSEKESRTPAYYTDASLTTIYRTGKIEPYVNWNSGYRLPTEAEWEKAARGGASSHRFSWGHTNNISHSLANYRSFASYLYDLSFPGGYHPTFVPGGEPYTSPAGYFGANGYGLYDMTGNVSEWCWDWYGLYSSGLQTDPHGPATVTERVVRGGSWSSDAGWCRVAKREYYPVGHYPDIGFRSALPNGQP
jgi:formylglycine-generating enzyme required for sulfatase activity